MKEHVKAKHMKVQVAGCDHVGLLAENVMEQLAVWPGDTIVLSDQGKNLTLLVESGLVLLTLSFGIDSTPVLLLVSSTASARSRDEDLC